MSNIERISNVQIKDLSILGKVCEKLGLILDLTRKTYKSKWADEITCAAVITDKQHGEAALVRRNDGYELQIDSYRNSLSAIIGDRCELLARDYVTEAVIEQVNSVGMLESVEITEDGSVVLQGVYL